MVVQAIFFAELRETFGVGEGDKHIGVNSDLSLLKRESLRFSEKVNARIALLWISSSGGDKVTE